MSVSVMVIVIVPPVMAYVPGFGGSIFVPSHAGLPGMGVMVVAASAGRAPRPGAKSPTVTRRPTATHPSRLKVRLSDERRATPTRMLCSDPREEGL